MKQRMYVMLVALLVMSMSAFAQQQRGERNERQQSITPEARAEQMKKDLDLTADQKAKVKVLFETQQKEMEKLRTEAQGDQANRREQATQLREKWDKELEKIIGKEKMAKHKALQAERMQNRRNRQQ
jgi:predicted RND superfamily exporter protein